MSCLLFVAFWWKEVVFFSSFRGSSSHCRSPTGRSFNWFKRSLSILGRISSSVVTPEPGTPGTRPGWRRNWPGWQIDYRAQMCPAGILGGPPRNVRMPPHTAHFSSNFPASYFPAIFACVLRQRRSTQSYALRYLSRVARQLIWPLELGKAWNLFACSECDPLQLCFGARRRFLHAASLMPWSLARGCSRTRKLERSPARCPRKTSLWRSGTGFGRWGNW